MKTNKTYHIYAIGNALVDMEFAVKDKELSETGIEKGTMQLVDETQYQKLYEKFYPKHGKRASGGSAANTIMAAACMGSKTFYTCKLADDEAGHFFVKDLLEAGIESNSSKHLETGTTGKCLVLITPDAERTMHTFLGISAKVSTKEVDARAIAASHYVYLEGYLAGSELATEAATSARVIAQQHKVKTALTFSDPNIVKFCKPQLERIIGQTPLDIIFCNEQEALNWADTDDLDAAVIALKTICNSFAITLGAKGALIYDGSQIQVITGTKVNAIDTNGAGDIFAGAFLHGINGNLSYFEAAKLANLAAARLVQHYGPRLEAAGYQALLEEFLNAQKIA